MLAATRDRVAVTTALAARVGRDSLESRRRDSALPTRARFGTGWFRESAFRSDRRFVERAARFVDIQGDSRAVFGKNKHLVSLEDQLLILS